MSAALGRLTMSLRPALSEAVPASTIAVARDGARELKEQMLAAGLPV